MSFRQYGTLKFINTHDVTLEHVRQFSMSTFGSLWKRGWITKSGIKLVLTKSGSAALEQYSYAMPNYRKDQSAELTQRVREMLHLRLHQVA